MKHTETKTGLRAKQAGALVVGAAVGVTAAILAAPRSGKDTRDRLKQGGDGLLSKLDHQGKEIDKGVRDITKSLSKLKSDTHKDLDKAVKKTRKVVSKTAKKVRS
jgi:gas vesicle protein